MPNTNSIQTLPVAGMSNQYDPCLREEASFISNLYPGANYIRVKYLDRSKNHLSLKIHLRAYGFDNSVSIRQPFGAAFFIRNKTDDAGWIRLPRVTPSEYRGLSSQESGDGPDPARPTGRYCRGSYQ